MPVRILVVDDNRDTLRTYTKALLRNIKPKVWGRGSQESESQLFVEIEEADTVSLALGKLRNQSLDLVVVDLKIPGISGDQMGGFEVIEESLKLDPLRPIIVITGYGSVELARKALTRGVFDFIEKSDKAVEDLIEAVQKAIDRRNEKMVRSGNPFRPMTGAEPSVFGGRSKELEFFDQKLESAIHTGFCEHFLVLGNWGIGKSALLKEYKKLAQSRGHIASIVPLESLQDGANLVDATRSIVEGIIRELPYSVDKFKKLAEYFGSIGFNIPGIGGLQFSRNTAKKDLSPQALLHDTLIGLWQDLEDEVGALLILLDDLDNFAPVAEIAMTLRQTLSMDSIKKTKILVGISSTPSNWQRLTSMERHHPLARFFISRVELAPLSQDELAETIIKSLSETGVSFSPEIMTRVFEYTQGHPFEMQVLCSHLFNNQLSSQVETDVWNKALLATLKDMGVAIFDYWFSQASNDEAKVLRIIAQTENPISAKEVQEMALIDKLEISSRNIPKYLQRLSEKKLLYKSGRGLYTIPDRMFCAYIQNRSD